jgi:hypothetical protein
MHLELRRLSSFWAEREPRRAFTVENPDPSSAVVSGITEGSGLALAAALV